MACGFAPEAEAGVNVTFLVLPFGLAGVWLQAAAGRHVLQLANLVGRHPGLFACAAQSNAIGLVAALEVGALQGCPDVLHEVALTHRPQLAVELLLHGRQVALQCVAHKANTLRLDAAAPAGGLVRVAHHVRRHTKEPTDVLYRKQAGAKDFCVLAVDAQLRRLQATVQNQGSTPAIAQAGQQACLEQFKLVLLQFGAGLERIVKVATRGKELARVLLASQRRADGFARCVGDQAGAT